MALPGWMIPTLAVVHAGASSTRSARMPTRPSPMASERPPMPPPTINNFRSWLKSKLRRVLPSNDLGRGARCQENFPRENKHGEPVYSGTIAIARVHPAEARWTFTGKQTISKPSAGSASRLCSFSRWRIADLAAGAVAFPDEGHIAGFRTRLRVKEWRVPAPSVRTDQPDPALQQLKRGSLAHAAAAIDVIINSVPLEPARVLTTHDFQRPQLMSDAFSSASTSPRSTT